jgi:ABC-type transport system substrate-binding protein
VGRRVVVLALTLSLATAAAGACTGRRGADGSTPTATPPSTSTTAQVDSLWGDEAAVEVPAAAHARGGSVRVGVWATPDPADPGLGGSAVRALVLPQLFAARPDGRWSPSLVEPKSDRTAADGRSATFRLRAGAVWSDGSPLTVGDLARTMDRRFVAAVEEGSGTEAGWVVVRFTAPLPGWRRLWSGLDSIAAPAPGVWGGPFAGASTTPGLETVLERNPSWVGGPAGGAFLDEVRLVLVPDAVTARQLLARGELDVVMPPAGTVRTNQLREIGGVDVGVVRNGGWSVSILANAAKLPADKRRALLASIDRPAFVGTLLAGEASVLDGYAGAEDATWSSFRGPGDSGALRGSSVDVIAFAEDPMATLVHRSMQKRARGAGGTLELRSAEVDRVEGWVRDGSFESGIVSWLDPPPGAMCWQCRFGDDPANAAADTGDPAAVAAAEASLRDDARVLPLWRPVTVVAWRTAAVAGVKANGFAASGAWNAWEWYRP